MNKEVMRVIDTREIFGVEFQIYGTMKKPLFLAKDVAERLEHKNASEMITPIDEEEKLNTIVSWSGQSRNMWFLTEFGLYDTLSSSRKPIAKQFKKEVWKILYEIRITGSYIVMQANEEQLKLLHEKYTMAQTRLEHFNSSLKTYTSTDIISSMTPEEKMRLKELSGGVRANNLHTYLLELGVVYKHNPANGDPYYIVTTDYAMLGLNKLEEVNTIHGRTGAQIVIGSTRWTTEGKMFIKELLLSPKEYLKEAKEKNKIVYNKTPNMNYLSKGVN